MLETILKLYSMAIAADVRGLIPHLFGPPGCGKSTSVEEAARIIGVNLHIINVSRLSPLDVEGVQMPHGVGEKMILKMLPATFWTQLKDGDILLFDEFLRGFPEVYNALLDIFTARRVGAFVLPKVFIIAASNSVVAYDKALEDRLLHLPVPDPRTDKAAKRLLAQLIVEALGLNPEMVKATEMTSLLDTQVLPMYEILDNLNTRSTAPGTTKGSSIRNLIGQAQLRQVQSSELAELLAANNRVSMNQSKIQYVFLTDGKQAAQFPNYWDKAKKLVGSKGLDDVQAQNLNLNLELIQLEAIRHTKGTTDDDVTTEPDLDDLLNG